MKNYQEFRSNPAIDALAGKRIWTVSTRDKCPIDMFEYLSFHKLRGAASHDECSLETLDRVSETFPGAANRACYLDSASTKLMVLDIEPGCPEPVKQRLLRFPSVYAERSMSGKGYHLLMKVPEKIIRAYPAVKEKKAMKHEQGWYEFLMDHYVTFTGDQVPSGGQDVQEFLAVFVHLAKQQVEARTSAEVAAPAVRDISKYDQDELLQTLLDRITDERVPFTRTPEQFNNDISSYEYAFMGDRYPKLQRLMAVPELMNGRELADEEIVYILYRAGQRMLPHRPKHEEARLGMPYLMFTAMKLYGSKKPRPAPPPDEED